MTNPCHVCQHRRTPEQQKAEGGYCYMWREEPHPCLRPHFKLDEFAFMQDILRQIAAPVLPADTSTPRRSHEP